MLQYSINQIDLISLFQLRDQYNVLPSCQREFVWSLRKQQGFIDSLLRGLPVPPVAYIESFVPLIGNKKELVDGQQRFETICRYFRNEFATAKSFSAEEVSPLFPCKKYCELPIDIRTRLDSYKLPMITISDSSDTNIGLVFRRWQGGEPLTYAEKLYSYDGVTKDIAKSVAGHRFWSATYHGDTKRRQPYQATIKFLLLEAYGGFANLTSPRQVDALTKISDWKSTPDRMIKRLNLVSHLFEGSDITAIGQAVVAYQGVLLLEDAGYKLSLCTSGCLTNWFMKRRVEALNTQRNGEGDFFAVIEKVNTQRKFWSSQWEDLTKAVQEGNVDHKRLATMTDKLALWVAQDGRCSVCGKDLRFRDGVVAHHVIPHANGGRTDVDNMMLVHTSCHQNAPIKQKVFREKP